MRGRNELVLNTATMIEAVQEYLDKRTTDEGRVKVVDIKSLSRGSPPVHLFAVDVAEFEEDE